MQSGPGKSIAWLGWGRHDNISQGNLGAAWEYWIVVSCNRARVNGHEERNDRITHRLHPLVAAPLLLLLPWAADDDNGTHSAWVSGCSKVTSDRRALSVPCTPARMYM